MAKVKILVVENEVILAEGLQVKLESLGYEVPLTVVSGEEAIQAAESMRPDLVLMDIKLDGKIDGIEAADQIRNRFDIPVVYLTAYSDENTLQRAKITEPYGYIVKPHHGRELHVTVEMALYKHRTENELKQAFIELEKLNTSKDRFFSILSHDLKGPFTGVMGNAELLSTYVRDFSPDEIEIMATDIYKGLTNLFKLLENLLEWSRLQLGKMGYRPQEIDLHEIVDFNIRVYAESAKQKNIGLTNSITSGTTAYADKKMIDTICRNLINNAIKFTKSGGFMTISADRRDKAVEVSVVDSGVGMNELVKEKLFRIDQKFTTTGTAGETGTGLGLILCRELVEKNGGEIWIETKKRKGSAFRFTLPIGKKDGKDE